MRALTYTGAPKTILDHAIRGQDAIRICKEQIQHEVDTADAHEDDPCDTDEKATARANILPSVGKLAKLPGSAQHVFDILFELNETAIGDMENSGYHPTGAHLAPYAELDDALVDAIIDLKKDGGLTRPNQHVRDIENAQDLRKCFGVEGYCERSLQLLRELRAEPILRMLVQKTLHSSILPSESIGMIEDALLEAHNIPSRDFEDLWKRPRPPPQGINIRGHIPSWSNAVWDPIEHGWKWET